MALEDNETGFQLYLREIAKFPLLTPAQEVKLARKIKKGDQAARSEMVRSNLRLVVKIARDYANLGLPLLDLISEGNIGLMKAVERFDPQKGGKLSTYAAWWIKQSIKRALANQSKTIRLPVHLVDKIAKMRRVSMQMTEELGREPTDDELAEEIGLAASKVTQLKSAAIRPASLTSRSATTTPRNSEKSSATKKRTIRSRRFGTRTCARKWANCSTSSTTANAALSTPASGSMGKSPRRSRRLERNSG